MFAFLLGARIFPFTPHWLLNICSPFAGIHLSMHAATIGIGNFALPWIAILFVFLKRWLSFIQNGRDFINKPTSRSLLSERYNFIISKIRIFINIRTFIILYDIILSLKRADLHKEKLRNVLEFQVSYRTTCCVFEPAEFCRNSNLRVTFSIRRHSWNWRCWHCSYSL